MAERPLLPSDAAAAVLQGVPARADAPSQVGHEQTSRAPEGSMSSGGKMWRQPNRRHMMPSAARFLGDQGTAPSQNSSATSSRGVGGARSNASKQSAAASAEAGSSSAAGSSTDSPAAPAADRRARLSPGKEAFGGDAHAGRYDLPPLQLLCTCESCNHVHTASCCMAVPPTVPSFGVSYARNAISKHSCC